MKKVSIKASPLKENKSVNNTQSRLSTRRSSAGILKSKSKLFEIERKPADPALVEKLFKIMIYLAKKENIMELKRQKLCQNPEFIPQQLLETIVNDKKKKARLTVEHVHKLLQQFPPCENTKQANTEDESLIDKGKDQGLTSVPSMRMCHILFKHWEYNPGSGYFTLDEFNNLVLPKIDSYLKSEVLNRKSDEEGKKAPRRIQKLLAEYLSHELQFLDTVERMKTDLIQQKSFSAIGLFEKIDLKNKSLIDQCQLFNFLNKQANTAPRDQVAKREPTEKRMQALLRRLKIGQFDEITFTGFIRFLRPVEIKEYISQVESENYVKKTFNCSKLDRDATDRIILFNKQQDQLFQKFKQNKKNNQNLSAYAGVDFEAYMKSKVAKQFFSFQYPSVQELQTYKSSQVDDYSKHFLVYDSNVKQKQQQHYNNIDQNQPSIYTEMNSRNGLQKRSTSAKNHDIRPSLKQQDHLFDKDSQITLQDYLKQNPQQQQQMSARISFNPSQIQAKPGLLNQAIRKNLKSAFEDKFFMKNQYLFVKDNNDQQNQNQNDISVNESSQPNETAEQIVDEDEILIQKKLNNEKLAKFQAKKQEIRDTGCLMTTLIARPLKFDATKFMTK